MIEQAIGNLSGIFWIFLLVIPLLFLKAFLQNPKVKGRIGERAVRSVIGKDLDEETYIEFHDLIIPSRSGTTQIDHIYVSVFGIFVIETKNYTGWIFGSEKQSKWTQVVYKQKHYFQNPLRQNYAHIKALSELLQLPEEKFHSMVVFLGDCELKTQMPPNVCRIRQAASYIRRFQTTLLLPQEIEAAIAVLSSNEYQADGEKLRAHTERLKERHQR
ncbi:nuclease-related domain-containing protein [Neisseria sp. HMSC064E01]|jgi:DNA topoisomerase|uniref:nuclease-related domain-containing protein n=1 Tax=Neisseria sp. HMSC064E01 TaxID=1715052 RepID=UPI0008A3970C|nr:nuclease-related domain-containing protein [Neisseria sp. HMSC064E01]OFN76241.1 nuclease [Neisseria sp. HMSC064E01]